MTAGFANESNAGCGTAFAQATAQLNPVGTGGLGGQARLQGVGAYFDRHGRTESGENVDPDGAKLRQSAGTNDVYWPKKNRNRL